MYCKKFPDKKCPVKVRITDNGALHADSEGMLKCCKGQEQLEIIRRLESNALQRL